jgi:hypothetical protein
MFTPSDAAETSTFQWKPSVFGGAPTDQAAINHGKSKPTQWLSAHSISVYFSFPFRHILLLGEHFLSGLCSAHDRADCFAIRRTRRV